jgi:hypothetical protein
LVATSNLDLERLCLVPSVCSASLCSAMRALF